MSATARPHALGARPGWAAEYEAMLEAYRQAGGDPRALQSRDAAVLVVSANRVLAAHAVEGVTFDAEELRDGIRARIVVAPHVHAAHPVHLCFGMVPEEGVQQIIAEYEIGAGARVEFIAHCTFPNATRLEHRMDARMHVGAGATMRYHEAHFHGPHGGIEVRPRAEVVVDEGGQFVTTFGLTHGRAGLLDIDYTVDVAARAVAELTTRAYGLAQDTITVRELVRLNGEEARGLTKTRVAVRDEATSQVLTTTEASAPGARGHMDCTEIVRGHAVAKNVPLIVVRDDRAQVTHEAAIGTVNRKELETLMARGLDEDDAVDLIIRGMLR
jgi:Fe-S cluster assembly scaffold protein SufB